MGGEAATHAATHAWREHSNKQTPDLRVQSEFRVSACAVERLVLEGARAYVKPSSRSYECPFPSSLSKCSI